MSLIELAALIFVGSTVIAMSFGHFSAGRSAASIRWSVLRERYYAAQALYAVLAIIAFLLFSQIVLACLGAIIAYTQDGIPDSAFVPLVAAAAAGGLLLLAVSPRLPVLKVVVSAIRRTMRSLARYPDSVDIVTALIGRAEFTPTDASKNELETELARFGVTKSLIGTVLGRDGRDCVTPAGRVLNEVCALHMNFAEVRSRRRFKRFFKAKQDQFHSIEHEYRHMLRRCARALLLVEDLNLTGENRSAFELEICSFISEEAQPLRLKYQRLLAEVAVSSLVGPASRVRNIRKFGYDIYLPDTIPLLPVVLICILDIVVFLIPSMLAKFAGVRVLSLYDTFILGTAHAASLAVAILLAIAPKKTTTFARPSLYHLPWRSYIIFGFLSWIAGALLTSAGLLKVQVPEGWVSQQHPFLASALFSIVFLLVTLLVSIRLDVRLKERSDEYRSGKVKDGVIVGVAMSAIVLVLQISLVLLAAYFGVQRPPFPAHLYLVSAISFGILGFCIGYLVPSTAEAHIDANRIILSSVAKKGKLQAIARDEVQLGQAWNGTASQDA